MGSYQTGSGQSYCRGNSWIKLMQLFPDNATAEAWFAIRRCGNEPNCPHCQSINVQTGAKHHTPFRCRKCIRRFSVRVGTMMQDSKLSFQVWAIATYILDTDVKGVSSMELHRDSDITRKRAWHLAYRIRKSWDTKLEEFTGPVELDESYIGGKKKDKHEDRKLHAGRGTVGNTAVSGTKDRTTKHVQARVVTDTTSETITGFVYSNSRQEAQVHTDDDVKACQALTIATHATVKHSVMEYVDGMAHINGMESFWSLLKRGYYCTHHKMSREHLQRYVD